MPEFHKILTVWYQENKRNLPWRLQNDPYQIWVSEIILQQTQVKQGTDYFHRFIQRFPDVNALAEASENDVLKLWQGLGYYSRARNMHLAAQQIVNEFDSVFPDYFQDIKKLKGIGEYTAAAIASIAFGLPYAAIDGNVYRVLSRIYGINEPTDSTIGKKIFADLANQLLDRANPALFNEAMMDFGSLQCTPRNPVCSNCPFKDQCFAYIHHAIASLPVKSKKIKVTNRFFDYLYICHSDYFYMEKRVGNDIWRNLYQLPLIESAQTLTPEELFTDERFKSLFTGMKITIGPISPEIIHILTHQRLHIRFFEIVIPVPPAKSDWIKVHRHEISDYPVPNPINDFLQKNDL